MRGGCGSYVCFLEFNTMTRLTGCWDPVYEFKDWSNVVCVIEGSTLEDAIMAVSWKLM